jgi:hypothetical protein
MEDPPYGLYTAGVDPYRQGKSAYSSSLEYIYKRMHSITGEAIRICLLHRIARPDKKEPGKSKLD